MNSLRKRIKSDYQQLTNTNKLIADIIIDYENKSFDLNLVNLAKSSFCSNSAITKFINYFGYSSYKIFVNDLNNSKKNDFETIVTSLDLVEVYFKKHNSIINNLISEIKTAPKIYLFATGQSKLAAIDFTLKGNKKESHKYIYEANTTSQKILLNTISNNDLAIFISNSGESRELINFVKSIDVSRIYLITNRDNSTLSNIINNTINLDNNIESKFNFKEFSKESKYTLLYFFDTLFEILYFD